MKPQQLEGAAAAYLQECYARGSPPRSSEFAAELRLPRSKLAAQFRETLGVTPSEYFKQKQIAAAEEMLLSTDLSITEICRRLAFGTSHTMRRLFYRYVGVTPEEYRRTRRNKG